jgi:hypothetical protein
MFVVLFLALEGYGVWSQPQPCAPVPIFRGITYTCEEVGAGGGERGRQPSPPAPLPKGAGSRERGEGYGLAHVVEVDLTAPGLEFYLTPLEPEAVARGFQYRLATAASVLDRQGLAVVVNATLFSSESGFLPRSGDWARGTQTIVADGQVSHVDRDSCLMWFEADLTPHVESKNPPDEAVLRRARWAVGSAAVRLRNGRLQEYADRRVVDRRTAIGVDVGRRRLWLAVFESASEYAALQVLARHGARDGFLLDGGHSTAMVIGPMAAEGKSGTVLGGWWPVATFFGLRAEPLRSGNP